METRDARGSIKVELWSHHGSKEARITNPLSLKAI